MVTDKLRIINKLQKLIIKIKIFWKNLNPFKFLQIQKYNKKIKLIKKAGLLNILKQIEESNSPKS